MTKIIELPAIARAFFSEHNESAQKSGVSRPNYNQPNSALIGLAKQFKPFDSNIYDIQTQDDIPALTTTIPEFIPRQNVDLINRGANPLVRESSTSLADVQSNMQKDFASAKASKLKKINESYQLKEKNKREEYSNKIAQVNAKYDQRISSFPPPSPTKINKLNQERDKKIQKLENKRDEELKSLSDSRNKEIQKVTAGEDKSQKVFRQFTERYQRNLAAIERDPSNSSLSPSEKAQKALQKTIKEWNEQVFTQGQKFEKISDKTTLFARGASDSNEIALNDINQEGFGNCYFLAAVGAVASRNPQIIRDMIQENKDAEGKVVSYTVTFKTRDENNPGKFRDVKITVDNEFAKSNKYRAELSGDRNNGADEIWVQVLEKAYAKYRGGLNAVNADNKGGDPKDVLPLLTGRESQSYNAQGYFFADPNVTGSSSLETDLQNGKFVVVSTRSNVGGRFGLVGNHAYTVQGVEIVNGQKKIILYNPWGDRQPQPIPFRDARNLFIAVAVN